MEKLKVKYHNTIKEKYLCDCGKELNIINKLKHNKTKNHLNYINNF